MGRLMFRLIGVSPFHIVAITPSSAQTLSLGPTRNSGNRPPNIKEGRNPKAYEASPKWRAYRAPLHEKDRVAP